MTGSQTEEFISDAEWLFWSSDEMTGSQTPDRPFFALALFWCSDEMTGSQTHIVKIVYAGRFGAVAN